MKTHIDSTLWVRVDPQVCLHTHDETVWVTVDNCLVVHALNYNSGESDLDTLENFFRKGLDAIQDHRQQRLFDEAHSG